ncbi:MAG: YbaB/EbfC family nucleoid-associated protein [Holosporales bacterium]|jgi:DNA-binding YbaB/EbfC family protein|nr:YbaB/EbfC family nucleoid-associated protein [Holosporales bacterium]
MDSFQQQAQTLLAKMTEFQELLGKKEVKGVSGAGLVEIVLNCKYDVKCISIDQNLLVPRDVKILEDLVAAAFRDATQKVATVLAEESERAHTELKIPGLPF